MRALAEKHRDDLVIFIGKEGAADLAESYGFENAVTAEDFHHEFPCVFPAAIMTGQLCGYLTLTTRGTHALASSTHFTHRSSLHAIR